jgi:transcriptional regulator with XRE-family HTH domain
MEPVIQDVNTSISLPSSISIGQLVKEWRLYRGLKPAQLAKIAQIPPNYISALESGYIKTPAFDRLDVLADSLGISVLDISERRLPPKEPTDITQQVPYANRSSTKRQTTLAAEIERQIIDSELSKPEQQLLAKHLMRVTSEMVDLIKASRETTKTREVGS